MKVKIDADEWYPVYTLEEVDRVYPYDVVVDVSMELFDRCTRVTAEFRQIQKELGKLCDTAEDLR
jgi:hypothetical protein